MSDKKAKKLRKLLRHESLTEEASAEYIVQLERDLAEARNQLARLWTRIKELELERRMEDGRRRS